MLLLILLNESLKSTNFDFGKLSFSLLTWFCSVSFSFLHVSFISILYTQFRGVLLADIWSFMWFMPFSVHDSALFHKKGPDIIPKRHTLCMKTLQYSCRKSQFVSNTTSKKPLVSEKTAKIKILFFHKKYHNPYFPTRKYDTETAFPTFISSFQLYLTFKI